MFRAFLAATLLVLSAAPALALTVPKPARVDRQSHTPLFSSALTSSQTVTVFADGSALIRSNDGTSIKRLPISWQLRRLLPEANDPTARRIIVQSLRDEQRPPYAAQVVNVVFRDSVTIRRDVVEKSKAYSTDAATNQLFAKLGVDRSVRMLRKFSRGQLASMRARATARGFTPLLDIANAFQIHVTKASVPQAVRALSRLRSVAYVEPDWTVSPMDTGAIPIGRQAALAARRDAELVMRRRNAIAGVRSALPNNYGLVSSLQSYLNAPGTDAVAAYDEIEKHFGQLPGQGETITNVSIGDECSAPGEDNSHVIGGQHYLDVPAMPLIPEYSADGDGNVSGSTDVCDVDASLGEVLLDFSVMAPLPHDMQRAGATGAGLTDLLGIAPGAKYRLMVPSTAATTSTLLGTFLGAANQQPAPNVITASLGFGNDVYGFPARFLEEDPLINAAIGLIVNADDIVVCVAAGDGLRLYTNAAVAPSGGSAPTQVTTKPASATNLNDDTLTTIPSVVTDTGSIDVGGSTTDDIFSRNPQSPGSAKLDSQLAFPALRWNGGTNFASGFGKRVDVSAPSDNIPTFVMASGVQYNDIAPSSNGGTSASAPQAAAAAAVLLQVARLTGHPFASATKLRSFLESTATAIPNVPQADMAIAVGPQIDVRRGVETLLKDATVRVTEASPRVAIAQRQPGTPAFASCFGSGQGYTVDSDTYFSEATDPTNIVLNTVGACNEETDWGQYSYITIAPDWEGVPPNARYELYVTGHKNERLATTPWARLLPQRIFAAAGLPSTSASARSVRLTYEVDAGFHILAASTFTLTFTPNPGTSRRVLQPDVAPVISGTTMRVRYDFSHFPASLVSNPVIVVSYPGRTNFYTGADFYPLYTSPVLTSTHGTIDIPVSALDGGGIYGVAIRMNDTANPTFLLGAPGLYSDFAMTRVAGAPSDARPAAPLLNTAASASQGYAAVHSLTVGYQTRFTLSYDVSSVPKATNAIVEISAAAPTLDDLENTFNNPNGTLVDDNGRDTGSVADVNVSGATGTVTIDPAQENLVPSMLYTVRVIPQAGTQPVGEASDVSSISENGLMAADGQPMTTGYSVNPNGSNIFYTDVGEAIDPLNGLPEPSQSFGELSEANGESFQYSQLVGAAFPPLALAGGGGFLGDDSVVYNQTPGLETGTNLVQTFYALPLASTAGQWNDVAYGPLYPPLPSSAAVLEMGNNASNSTAAFLFEDHHSPSTGATQYGVFTANVQAKTSTAPVYLAPHFTAGLQSVGQAYIDYDPIANVAYVLFQQQYSSRYGVPYDVLAGIDIATGTVTYTSLGRFNGVDDFVIDPNTKVAAFTDSTGVAIVNLATLGVTATVTIPAVGGATLIALDSQRQEFLVQVPEPTADTTDDNPLSGLAVVSESGALVNELPRQYDFSLTYLHNHWFGVNPATHTGYVFGENPAELVPVSF